jgi:pyrroline-5-carboxylate reductase
LATKSRLLIVGGGNMGRALVGGLLDTGWAKAEELVVVEKLPAAAEQLASRYPGLRVANEPEPADGVVIAVKPPDVESVCHDLAAAAPGAPVLSIAAGVRLEKLESWLAPNTPVVRAMPNTPAFVGAGAAAIAPGSAATDQHLAWAEEILGAVGIVVRLDEEQLDAVTGLSGSGPAYVFLVVESLIEAGIAAGLPPDVARLLTVQTVAGAGRLLQETGSDPAELREAVTSKGGTTEAGLRVLDERGVREAFAAAVAAAAERARQLG